MAKKNTDIFSDPRYPAFVERYQNDPLRFAVEVSGLTPSFDQMRIFKAIKPQDARVSVVSGTGTGKTFAYARIALWHLLCFPVAVYDSKVEIGSNTYIGAPFIQQVGDGVWKEMKDTRLQIANGPHSWILDYFDIAKTRVTVKGYESQWFIAQIAMTKVAAGRQRWFYRETKESYFPSLIRKLYGKKECLPIPTESGKPALQMPGAQSKAKLYGCCATGTADANCPMGNFLR